MVNLGCHECVDQSFTVTARDLFTDLSNVAQVVKSRLTYAVYLFVRGHDSVEPRTDVSLVSNVSFPHVSLVLVVTLVFNCFISI